MTRVCVVQTDNRPTLDYLLKTQEVNKMFCDFFHYDYLFIEIDNASKFSNKQYEKIYVVNSLLQKEEYDVLVFLDSDAWIQNGFWLNDIIDNLINNENVNGCFSRDPYITHNTYINSGSFIIKCNIFTKNVTPCLMLTTTSFLTYFFIKKTPLKVVCSHKKTGDTFKHKRFIS